MARKRRSPLPADVVAHQPVPFDDSIDLPETLEGVTPPPRVPQLSALPALPLLPVRRSVYLGSSTEDRGMGREPHGKPHTRDLRRSPVVSRVVRVGPPFNAKQIGVRKERELNDYRRLLFNRLAVPFSRRADVCVKRTQRRQVIFAKRYSGRNGGKVYRRTYASSYSC